MNFLDSPNLPQNRVSHAFVGEKYVSELCEPLKKLGINALTVELDSNLPEPVSSHSDMLLMHLGENRLIFTQMQVGFAELRQNGAEISVLETALGGKYPLDVTLNMLIIGKYVFGNAKCVTEQLYGMFKKEKLTFVDVRQGYAKCSVCIIDEHAVITADSGLKRIFEAHGIEALKISEGFINLDGYDYGFIGGASGKLAKDILAFTGTLSKHPDRQRIENFASKYGVEIICLTDRDCFDIGSIIPIIEYGNIT